MPGTEGRKILVLFKIATLIYLRDLLVEVLEAVPHEGDVLLGLLVVGAAEGRHARQHDVCQDTQRPDVRLRVRRLVVHDLGRWGETIM